jgi:hypothetical protein
LPTIAVANLRDKDPELWAALTTNLLSTAAGRIDRLRALLAGVTD